MDNRLQTKVLALAMQIIGIKDPGLFKLAMTMMSEQGRSKFLARCALIILSGDASEESIALAQLEALQAILEGQLELLAILAKHGNRITYLNRFYSGGAVLTYDGGYMKLKKPLTKDLLEGRLSLGLYKGKWMYLNGDKVAVPNLYGKQKGDDGSTHINRAYNGMLIPKPLNYVLAYSLGGIFSSVGNWVGNAAKNTGQWLKGAGSTIGKALNTAANFVDKNQKDLTGGAQLLAGLVGAIGKMKKSGPQDFSMETYNMTEGGLALTNPNPKELELEDLSKVKQEEANTNGSPLAKNELLDFYQKQMYEKIKNFMPLYNIPKYSIYDSKFSKPSNLSLNLDTSLLYPRPDNTLTLNTQ